MRADAVVRQLMVIGEASTQVSESFKERFPQMNWKKIRGMRNFLVHEYFGINVKIVWETCRHNLPDLYALVKTTLDSEGLDFRNSL